MLLEVIVQSVADAVAAEAGGAGRLEVVREIERGGLTPSVDLVHEIRSATALPLRVMVRENDGFEVGPGELPTLRDAARRLEDAGVDGIVIGFARAGALVLDDLARVLAAAPGVRATFHRAFDSLSDPLAAIDALLSIDQVDRVLTSGGDGTAAQRVERLRDYAVRPGTTDPSPQGTGSVSSPSRLTIIAGGGVTEEMVSLLACAGAIREVHVGRAAREGEDPSAAVSAVRVRRLCDLISQSS
ncbi:MAG: copper homeostasis protein CutC [Acidobacteriota bacterium]